MAVAVTTATSARAKIMNKKMKTKKSDKSNIILVAQELKFARTLAGNDKRVRDKVLKKLRRWLTIRSQSSFVFTDNDFMRLWKGLFYCMWMSDKPLVQEQLSENIANLVQCFKSAKIALQFYKCFLKTMQIEWFGIDQLRLDKFLMLVRRVLRQILIVISKTNWKTSTLNRFGNCLSEAVLFQHGSLGLTMHLSEIYIEEISKVSGGNINENAMTILLKPFTKYLSECSDARPIAHVCNNVFRVLMSQSDAGQDHEAKFEAWRNQGFPGGNIDYMQKVDYSEDEDEIEEDNYEKPIKTKKKKNKNKQEENEDVDKDDLEHVDMDSPLDPRAGNVDVILSQIPFKAGEISEMILSYRFNKETNMRSRKALTQLAEEFKLLEDGTYPLGIRQVKSLSEEEKAKPNIKKSALDLLKFEKKQNYDKVKGLPKKQRKRYLKMLEQKQNGELDDIEDSSEIQDENEEEPIEGVDNEIGDVIKIKKTKKKNLTEKPIKKKNLTEKPIKKKKRKSEEKVEIDNVETKKPKIVENGSPATPIRQKSVVVSPKKSPKRHSNSNAGVWKVEENMTTPKNKKIVAAPLNSTEKRVKIMLNKNISQDTFEYERQLKSSPQIPYDASKKPSKTLLKPNLVPSPVNPFYIQKNGIKF